MRDKSSEFRERLEHQLEQWALPKGLADTIVSHLTLVTYDKGAIISQRGSSADFVFCLLNGFAKLYLLHADGHRTLIGLARPGDIFGFVDSLDSENRRVQVFDVHALTRCSVGLVSRDYLIKLLHTLDSDTIITLLEHINTTWSRLFEWYAAFMGLPFRERLRLVLENLKGRVGVSDQRGILLLPALTHEDLAEMIGSSRPMVSRVISELARDGLLTRGEKSHYLLRPDGKPARSAASGLNGLKATPVPYSSGETAFSSRRGSTANPDPGCASVMSLSERKAQRDTRVRV